MKEIMVVSRGKCHYGQTRLGIITRRNLRVLNKELMVVLHFLIEYFGYTIEKTYRWGETQGSWYRNLGKR